MARSSKQLRRLRLRYARTYTGKQYKLGRTRS